MLARIRKSQENNEGGFTLIELLVVMIIIGILAAIAIPAFLNQRAKARETSAKSDVSTIGKEIAAYYVDGTGVLSVTQTAGTPNQWNLIVDGAATPLVTGRLSSGNSVTASVAGNFVAATQQFCVAVTTQAPVVSWKYSAAGGLQQGTCGTGTS